MADLTFAQLRHMLGFGVVRLKLLLAIQREVCLDSPGWEGRFVAEIGGHSQVKTQVQRAPQEVTIDEEMA